ncbi:MAG: amidohydrolase [Thalassobius sp.]|nr:amidohydrolase [Thalassovita sp.]
MKFFKLVYTLLLACIAGSVLAQVPSPGKPQEKPIALVGVTAHIGNGSVVEDAVVGFDKGKITIVDAKSNVSDDKLSGYEVFDLAGKHVYPGFIIPATDLGLTEIGAVRATRDSREIGELNPNIRSIIAYNTDSENIPTFRFNGILYAQITPQGGRISGSSSVVGLDAWNWEDAVVKMDEGIHINWPGKYTREFDFATFTVNRVPNKEYDQDVQSVKTLLDDTKSYIEIGETSNLKLEAMKGLFDGSKTMYVHTGSAQEIVESIKILKGYGIKKIVLVEGEEALLVADFLKENDIPVIVTDVHRLPSRAEDPIDLPYALPSLLVEQGLTVSLMYDGVSNARNLPFYAGTAATYGMGKEEALKCITLNAAKILGIDDVAGSLETGKDASLFVSEGDALDMRTNILERAYFQGRFLDLEGIQQRLYQKYKEKYEAAGK